MSLLNSITLEQGSVVWPTDQGLGWRHPYYTQGLRHIQTLFKAPISCSQIGALLCHTAEAFWVELGVSFSLGGTLYK